MNQLLCSSVKLWEWLQAAHDSSPWRLQPENLSRGRSQIIRGVCHGQLD
jgi:hypothetical protein